MAPAPLSALGSGLQLLRWLGIGALDLLRLAPTLARELRIPGPEVFLRLHGVKNPSAPALRDSRRRYDFATWARLSRRAAGTLAALGLRTGDRVAVFSTNRAEVPIATFAILTAGLKPVAVNYRLTPPELAYILGHSGAKALFYEQPLEEVALEACKAPEVAIDTDRQLALEDLEHADEAFERTRLPPAPPETPATIYTSGTTGRPKGAVITPVDPAGLVLAMGQALGFPLGGAMLMPCPLYHSAPTFLSMLCAAGGGELRILEKYSAEQVLEGLRDPAVGAVFLVPFMLEDILAAVGGEEGLRAARPAGLRALYSSAAPLRPETKRAYTRAWGEVLYEFYGSTEAGIVTILRPEEALAHAETVGRAAPGVSFQILDERLRPLPPGEVGQVCAASRWHATRYHDDAAATAAAHLGGAFLTGDLGRADRDGYLTICGRASDMVISGGVNLYPAEVEAVLARHPLIREVAVVGLPDPRWGEALHAVLVDDGSLTHARLDAWCRRELAGFKVPRVFHRRDALPRNPSGKILKRVLREELLAERGDG